MTHEEFKAQLEAIPNLELVEKAQTALSKLCSTGGQSFKMTVPPRIDDTDIILSEVIKRFKLLHLEAVKNCTSKVKKLNKADVSGRSEQCCSPTDGFYLGTTCPHCNKPFRKDIK